jgi:hypothetical protein
MFTYLSKHPEVFMAPAKEIGYFGRDWCTVPDELRPATPEEYLAHFEGAGPVKRIGEATTSYLYSKTAAREIKAFNPDARIIIMLRHPVEAISSLHEHYVRHGSEPALELEEAIADEPRRLRLLQEGTQMPCYRDQVRYAEQVERYLDAFGRDRVHVVIFSEFVADTATYRRTLSFLGVDPAIQPDFTRENQGNYRIRSGALKGLAKTAWKPPKLVSRVARVVLPNHDLRRKVADRVRLWSQRPSARPPVDTAVRRELISELRPDIERLGTLLDRDLGFWLDGAS